MPLWRPAFPGSFREEREVETAITPRGFPRKERCCRCARRSDRLRARPGRQRAEVLSTYAPKPSSPARRSETPKQFEARWAGKARPPPSGRSCSESHPGSAARPMTTRPSFRAGPSGRFGRLAFRAPARGGSNPDRPYVGPLIVCGRFTPPSGRPFNPRPRQRARHSRLILPQPGRSSRQDGTGFTKPDRDARVRYGGAKTGDNGATPIQPPRLRTRKMVLPRRYGPPRRVE